MSDEPAPVEVSSANLAFVEELYHDYLENPDSVSSDWRAYFAGFNGNGKSNGAGGTATTNGSGRIKRRRWEMTALQHRVDRLCRNFRARGHREAKLDPLGLRADKMVELSPEFHGLDNDHMELKFTYGADGKKIPLREIVARMRQTYCSGIGVQFMHIDSIRVREWLQTRMEATQNSIQLQRSEQLRILTRLTDAVMFEEFIQNKYVGAKSFSLEGGESLIPLLDMAIEKAGDQGIKEIVIGMAHRGRLNVLANIMGKSPRQIFREYEDNNPELHVGRGDVKYHLGYHTDWITKSEEALHLALCFNPSHLEYVNPVALGRLRAKQDRVGDLDRELGMCLLIHGDAAFAGEGIVPETLNLSELWAYETGGTLHVIVNNQIGFTTNPEDARSGAYATGMAKILQVPIFHVNGENPEAVAQVVQLAMDFRKTFRRDVIIDMWCYRKRGHNEGDEPSFTQPLMYKAIKQKKSVRDSYLDNLLKLGGITKEEADEIAAKRRAHLEEELANVRREDKTPKTDRPSLLGRIWSNYRGGPENQVPEVKTSIPADKLSELLIGLTELPEGFTPHPKIVRLLETRRKMATGEAPIDWAAAEALAYGTLACEGFRLRMSGQDVQRGTFSHRHAVLHDFENGSTYCPLQHLSDEQGPVEFFNSPLSEAAVLGFEYGYSVAYPDALVIWEAQFGDFVNVAQPIIDQFIASAEDKWRSLSGLVMLLPHGYEGMGPEHSSARLERFLSLAAEDNIQIVYPSTPAQYFHMLRRQVVRSWRKPLFVMTPKSLLRNPDCVSTMADLSEGRFHRMLGDETADPKKVKRILLCSGKIYYDLAAARKERGLDNVAILRVEQLYPMAEEVLYTALAPYRHDAPVYWVQEEPENMGAWRRVRGKFGDKLIGRPPLKGVSRPASASPATGSHNSHKLEQQRIIDEAFADL